MSEVQLLSVAPYPSFWLFLFMKTIALTQGFVALVDDEDFDLVADIKWYPKRTSADVYYAYRGAGGRKPDDPSSMHQLIMNSQPGQLVDHKNRNGLDNRRENLRFATRSQNMANQKKHTNGRYRYKGVTFHWQSNMWVAQLVFNKKKHVKYRRTELEAALAYDEMAAELYGEFARPNFPLIDE